MVYTYNLRNHLNIELFKDMIDMLHVSASLHNEIGHLCRSLLALGIVAKHNVTDSLRHSTPETEALEGATKLRFIGLTVMSAFRVVGHIYSLSLNSRRT